MPSRGGRAPSGPWGRLKPVEQDPLESVGLPSKGDNRLLDRKAQEKYYTKIMERYMSFCSDAGQRDELLKRFSSMALDDAPAKSASGSASRSSATPTSSSSTTTTTAKGKGKAPVDKVPEQLQSNNKALTDVLMALRKLREGIVANKRADDFAIQAYLFCIRLSILVKKPESYHPAILHLLRAIHPLHPLTPLELQEVVGYLILDTACRRRDLGEAYALRRRHGVQARDPKVGAVLRALTHDNYVEFRRLLRAVDAHRARLMEWAEPEVRLHTLKCLGRTYMSVELGFLEAVTGSTWDRLRADDGVGWELDDNKVVIRKVKTK